jgi:hypothetical protein
MRIMYQAIIPALQFDSQFITFEDTISDGLGYNTFQSLKLICVKISSCEIADITMNY